MFHKITIQKSKSPLSGHGLHLSLKPPWNTSDLVTCFNIVYGLFDLPFDNFFQTPTNYRSTRGHSMKLQSVVVKLDHFDSQLLFDQSLLADKACLLSVSAPHAASWLSVIPSVGLGLHLDPDEISDGCKVMAWYRDSLWLQLCNLP